MPHLGPRVRCSWRVCICHQKMHIYLILVYLNLGWVESLNDRKSFKEMGYDYTYYVRKFVISGQGYVFCWKVITNVKRLTSLVHRTTETKWRTYLRNLHRKVSCLCSMKPQWRKLLRKFNKIILLKGLIYKCTVQQYSTVQYNTNLKSIQQKITFSTMISIKLLTSVLFWL